MKLFDILIRKPKKFLVRNLRLVEHCYDYNFTDWKPLKRTQQGVVAHPTPVLPAPAPNISCFTFRARRNFWERRFPPSGRRETPAPFSSAAAPPSLRQRRPQLLPVTATRWRREGRQCGDPGLRRSEPGTTDAPAAAPPSPAPERPSRRPARRPSVPPPPRRPPRPLPSHALLAAARAVTHPAPGGSPQPLASMRPLPSPPRRFPTAPSLAHPPRCTPSLTRPPPRLTLLQVLLVVPGLILADLELLHQAVGQHRAPSPPGRLSRQRPPHDPPRAERGRASRQPLPASAAAFGHCRAVPDFAEPLPLLAGLRRRQRGSGCRRRPPPASRDSNTAPSPRLAGGQPMGSRLPHRSKGGQTNHRANSYLATNESEGRVGPGQPHPAPPRQPPVTRGGSVPHEGAVVAGDRGGMMAGSGCRGVSAAACGGGLAQPRVGQCDLA